MYVTDNVNANGKSSDNYHCGKCYMEKISDKYNGAFALYHSYTTSSKWSTYDKILSHSRCIKTPVDNSKKSMLPKKSMMPANIAIKLKSTGHLLMKILVIG